MKAHLNLDLQTRSSDAVYGFHSTELSLQYAKQY